MSHIDWNLVVDFVLANVFAESLKYATVKVLAKIDVHWNTFLDI